MFSDSALGSGAPVDVGAADVINIEGSIVTVTGDGTNEDDFDVLENGMEVVVCGSVEVCDGVELSDCEGFVEMPDVVDAVDSDTGAVDIVMELREALQLPPSRLHLSSCFSHGLSSQLTGVPRAPLYATSRRDGNGL